MKNVWKMICLLLLVAACNQQPKAGTAAAPAETQPAGAGEGAKAQYGLKSAVVVTETDMPGGHGTMEMKVTFDDYGKEKLTEMTMNIAIPGHNMNTVTKSIYKDGYVYSWNNMTKTGTKMKLDLSRIDKKDLDITRLSEEMKAKMHLKEEGTETVGGKECKVFSYDSGDMKGKLWLYKQIQLKSEMTMAGHTVITNFKSIDENPGIAAGTFDLPAGIEFREVSIPAMGQ